MNSVILFALLIFTSAARGDSSSSYSDFTELDGGDFQNEFFENEVLYTSSSDEKQTQGNEEDDNSVEETVRHAMEQPAPVLAALNEGAAGKHIGHFLVHPFDHYDSRTVFPNEETKQYQAPKRRDIKEWIVADDFFDSNNLPWSVDAYYQSLQNEYLDNATYSNEKTQEGPSVVVAGDYKDHNNQPKQPQYFQKNYYYNYYPFINERKRWNLEEVYRPEESKKRMETAVGRKVPSPNPCKQYLEFLKYAFEQLDDQSEYYYEPSEEYVVEWRDREEPKAHRLFGTQLLGPTFYVDNSGKISQINTNGNSVQIAEGISPESKISIFSKSPPKPKSQTTVATTPTNQPTTISDNSHNSNTGTKNETETTTDISHTTQNTMKEKERPETTTIVAEPTTVKENDDNAMKGNEETREKETGFYTRRGLPMNRKPLVETETVTTETNQNLDSPITTTSSNPTTTSLPLSTTIFTPPSENRIKVKTILTLEESTEIPRPEDADCNDKMLPCPDTVNITYPLNGYCNRYVSCESGRAIRRTCPEGLHFNLIIKSCDLPHNSFCTYACPQPDGHFGIPGDCGGYFVCKNSNPEYRMCPPRMHWDIKKSSCTFSQLSTCPMKCLKDNEVKHYEGDCKAYIVCLNGIPYYHKCPPNTKFDKTSLVCVPDEKSNCVDDSRLLTNTLNPNVLCKDVQIQLNTKSWCRSFLPFVKD